MTYFSDQKLISKAQVSNIGDYEKFKLLASPKK